MKTNVKRKAGISLIVLVITIIVMIILATAIILSLSNSGIISKANKAKTDSDTANLKEYVNTLRAEYELMTEDERNGQTFEAYANEKLDAKGYNRMLSEDGILMTESATAAVKAGIKVGDKVEGYTLTEKSYTTSGDENTATNYVETTPGTKQTLNANTQVTWKYIGIGEDGSLEITPDVASITSTSPTMTLSGKGGYLNGLTELDKACAALYSTDKGTAKSMNIDHVTRILGYTGEKGAYYDSAKSNYTLIADAMTIGDVVSKKGEPKLTSTQTPNGKDTWEEIKTYKLDGYHINKTADVGKMQNAENVDLVYASTAYWLASPCVSAEFSQSYASFCVRCVNSNSISPSGLFGSMGISDNLTCSIRPVVSLNSNVTLTKSADGVWNIS